MATAEVAGVYIDKLKEIEAATGGNVQQNQEYQNTLALLLRTMPELSDSISQTTDQYSRVTYTLAGSAADLKTDFSATMDELQQELTADIEAMDLGDEAAASGRATVQGYIDAANDMLPEVQAAYKALARAASNALGPPSYSNSAYAQLGDTAHTDKLMNANLRYREYYTFPAGIVLVLPEISQNTSDTLPPWKQVRP